MVEKQIKKEEKRQSSKEHVSDLSTLPKSPLSSSRAANPRPSSSMQNPRRRSTYSPSLGSIQSGESLTQSNDAAQSKKYTLKGKETRAPRGRMGGVPLKTSESGRATPSVLSMSGSRPSVKSRAGSDATGPSNRGRPNDSESWKKYKVWNAPGKTQPFGGLEDDPDMWMPSGDCLIYFLEETSYDDPKPSLRVHVSMLEQANSNFLSNLIRYGELVQNDDDDLDGATATRESVLYNSIQPFTRFDPRSADDDAILPAPPKLGTGSFLLNSQRMGSDGSSDSRGGMMSPSGSRSDMDAATIVEGYRSEPPESEITHELWLKAPSHITVRAVQRRYSVATRNFFAMLYGKPLVGTDICEMLGDLQNVTDTLYELNDPSDTRNATQDIIYYLTERKMDDVRNNLRYALRFLHWCESQPTRWEEGYTECFIHCVGMMDGGTFDLTEFTELSKQSRSNLENAYSELQLRILDAQERLQSFNFRDIWDVGGVSPNSQVQRSFDAFRDFVYRYYAGRLGVWPPHAPSNGRGGQQRSWLTRDLARRLQDDFGAVYDYLVDRSVVFDANETRSARKWEIVSTGLLPAGFSADSPGLPLTDMFVAFDAKGKYMHIPHPFPLLPQPQNPAPGNRKTDEKKRGLLGKLQKKNTPPASGLDQKELFQTSLAFNGATNINRTGLPPLLSSNAFIDALSTHEKSLPLAIGTPRMARLGRWVFIYGILQTLSSISIDTHGLRYKDGVSYFLCPKLEGCPPWHSLGPGQAEMGAVVGSGAQYVQWSQTRSYCFLAAQRWVDADMTATPPAYDARNAGSSYLDLGEAVNAAAAAADPPNDVDSGDTPTPTAATLGALPRRTTSRMAFRGEVQTGPNSIGVALFPDFSDLKIDEEDVDLERERERDERRGNVKVQGGVLKPRLPMGPVSPDLGAIDDRWRLDPGKYGRT